MKVKELIRQLETCEAENEVQISNEFEGGMIAFYPIQFVTPVTSVSPVLINVSHIEKI